MTIGPALAAIPVLVFRAPALRLLPKRRAWLAWLNLVVALALVALAVTMW